MMAGGLPSCTVPPRARNERFREGDVFRRVFERVVETCIAAGLVGVEGFAVDASLNQVDANKQRLDRRSGLARERDPASSSRAVKEYLASERIAKTYPTTIIRIISSGSIDRRPTDE